MKKIYVVRYKFSWNPTASYLSSPVYAENTTEAKEKALTTWYNDHTHGEDYFRKSIKITSVKEATQKQIDAHIKKGLIIV